MADELEKMKKKLSDLERRVQILERTINNPARLGKLLATHLSTLADTR